MSAYTKGPWTLGEYDEHLGYDCMTGGVRTGPVCLDGNSYGQRAFKKITPEQLDQLMADARLIAAAPELLEACRGLLEVAANSFANRKPVPINCPEAGAAMAAIAKATGETA